MTKIFPGADILLSPEEIFMPQERPEDPTRRLHLMRKIHGTSGYARLYGAKDIDQFIRQSQYMADFTDDYPREIPFGDTMPTYADMSTAQLRCYFSWRTGTFAGRWEAIPYPYVLLRVFELLNQNDNPEQTALALADCWLHMRSLHHKLDARMPQWFKDYYICHSFTQPFADLVKQCALSDFFPEHPQRHGLLSLSSYSVRESRFFREQPGLLTVLEAALNAAAANLAPLFLLYGVNQEETFYMKPARFSHHELYRDAVAQPPKQSGQREVRLSHSEIYRLQGGSCSCAMEDAFRPPSHAIGYVVKRLETALRRCAGFDAAWRDPEASNLLERWLQSDPHAYNLADDPRLSLILTETACAAYHQYTNGGGLPPSHTSSALAAELAREPMHAILSLRKIKASPSQFLRQGKRLVNLSDDYDKTAQYATYCPEYAEMSPSQLRTYLTWRTKLRAGEVRYTDIGYALLYTAELEAGLGTEDVLVDLCRFLRDYAPLDKLISRRLPARIVAYAESHNITNLTEILRQQGVEAWFPSLFLFSDCDQLLVFDQLSTYRLTRSRFYKPNQHTLYRDCFTQVLQAAVLAFKQAGLDLRKAMHTADAPQLAAFLLKRMEQQLRLRVKHPYVISANAEQMLNLSAHARKRMRSLLSSGALAECIDAAVEAFAQTHELSPLASTEKTASRAKKAQAPIEADQPPQPPVTIDFTLLPEIRAQARELTERLIVEEAQDEPPIQPPQVAADPSPVTEIDLIDALTPSQLAIIHSLVKPEGTLITINELDIEAINEVALAVIGDILIDGDALVEEYAYLFK